MLKSEYTKKELKKIKDEVIRNFVINIGANIAQFYIREADDTQNDGNISGGFLITISSQTNKRALPRYEALLCECVQDYRKRKDYYLNEAKLSLEQALKYCIISNDMRVSGFVRLDNCNTI